MKRYQVLVIRKEATNEVDIAIIDADNEFHARINYILQFPPGYINWGEYKFEVVEFPIPNNGQ